MSFGTVQAGYSGETYRYTQAKSQAQSVRGSNFTPGQKYAEQQNTGEVIGQARFYSEGEGKSYDLRAQYAPESTPDNPVVQVTVHDGKDWVSYYVNVNEVDPNNATQLEMFALLSYADDQGISLGGNKDSYELLRLYTDNAKQNGYWEGNASYDDFVQEKHNWTQLTHQMLSDYSEAGIYSQFRSCSNIEGTLRLICFQRANSSDVKLKDRATLMSSSSTISLPAVPDEVMKAFFECLAEAERKGMDHNLSTRVINDMLRRVRMLTDGQDCTLEIALQAAREALEGLDYSLTPELAQSKELQEELDTLRGFYQSLVDSLEELKAGGAEKAEEAEEDTIEEDEFDAWKSFVEMLEMVYHSMLRREGDTSYEIGAQSFTEKDWKRFLERFDALEKELRELVRERIEKQKEEAQRQQGDDGKSLEELLNLLFEDRDENSIF